MYNKTTSPTFFKYGTIAENKKYTNNALYDVRSFNNFKTTFDHLMSNDESVFIEITSGIALLLVTNSIVDTLNKFVIHRVIELKPKILFNIIPLTPNISYNLYYKKDTPIYNKPLDIPYIQKRIIDTFYIKEIYSYYYNVKSSQYHFNGEKHDFYELTYVDNGSIVNIVDGVKYELNDYELMLFGPGQFHEQLVDNNKPCSFFTINFDLRIHNKDLLLNKKFKVNREILARINDFVKESSNDIPLKEDLLISIFKEILILLIQQKHRDFETKPTTPLNQKFESELLNEIIDYIGNNLFDPLSIDDICSRFSISRSSLQNLFKENLKIAPKHYINEIKLAKSRLLIKENKYSISNIASMLGFSSIHYFSRKFTQRYNVTPTDYAKAIYKGDKNLNN